MSTRKRLNEARRRRSQRNLIYAGIAAVLVAAAVVSVALARQGDSPAAATPQTYPIAATGHALPAFDGTNPDPAVGLTIPEVTGTTLDGRPASITDDGKAKVILFVAHWCPHCRREVPLLADYLRKTPLPSTVEIVTISTGVNADAPNYPPSTWLAGAKWPTSVIADDGRNRAATAFGLTGYPYFVFVDAHDNVQSRSSGEMSLTEFHDHVAAIAG
jgi:thiol-disulfide isomerase/thioredoxin